MNPSASFTLLHGAVAGGVVALSLAQVPSSWPVNLLENPDGSAGTVGWSRAGDAAMGGAAYDGVFVVREVLSTTSTRRRSSHSNSTVRDNARVGLFGSSVFYVR